MPVNLPSNACHGQGFIPDPELQSPEHLWRTSAPRRGPTPRRTATSPPPARRSFISWTSCREASIIAGGRPGFLPARRRGIFQGLPAAPRTRVAAEYGLLQRAPGSIPRMRTILYRPYSAPGLTSGDDTWALDPDRLSCGLEFHRPGGAARPHRGPHPPLWRPRSERTAGSSPRVNFSASTVLHGPQPSDAAQFPTRSLPDCPSIRFHDLFRRIPCTATNSGSGIAAGLWRINGVRRTGIRRSPAGRSPPPSVSRRDPISSTWGS